MTSDDRDKPVILAVDDDPPVLRQLARDLTREFGEDYQVLRATSGAEGIGVLDELARSSTPVALTVSDQRMPGIDGVTVLAHARRSHATSKRVLLTAYADTDAAIKAINQSQVDYYLTKPWDPPAARLYPVVSDLLRDWRRGYRPGYGGVRVVGSRWTPAVQEVRDFLSRHHRPFEFIDIERHEEPEALLASLGLTRAELPAVLLPDGERVVPPTTASLAPRLDLRTTAAREMYDFAIIGGGPAGLAAAVYGASEGLKTVLIEGDAPGGQAGTSSRIENYLGFPAGVSGGELARRALQQAERFGVEFLSPQRICEVRLDLPYKHLACADGPTLSCKALLIASGVSWRKLVAPGADRLSGRGVYYGAVTIEPRECAGESIFVVGAGNSAGQAASYLAEHGAQVTMLVRGRSLGEKMSQYLVDRLEARERNGDGIRIRYGTEVAACAGDEHLDTLTLVDGDTGASEEVAARFLFVFIGAAPNTAWLGPVVARDRHGFVLTGPDLTTDHLLAWPLTRNPYLLEASVPGIFAAGDVRHESVKRVASAVGEGSVTVHFVHRYLASL
jgi:thioredoxin reductase (NADPH)